MSDPVSNRNEHLFKVIVIGRVMVGKTSFIQCYIRGCFMEHYKATLGVDFAIKTIQWSNHEIVRLQFWDIQGQEDVLKMTRAFYKNVAACIIMFDVTSEKSFQFCKMLKEAVDSEVWGEDGLPIPCILLANKCDLSEWAMTKAAVDQLCSDYDFVCWKEISVKRNEQVEESVRCLIEVVLERSKNPLQPVQEPALPIQKSPPWSHFVSSSQLAFPPSFVIKLLEITVDNQDLRIVQAAIG
ncbi:ras-related protein Rab-7L1-like [Heptranchias perlo]|uniref:ras-related protein Rab-7L1-like n=1 Tax=Heptranchias perlo TaxID=212740 RepID=UPI00355A5C32